MSIDTARMKERLEKEKATLSEELSMLGRKDPERQGGWDPQSGDEAEAPEADKNVAADRIEELVSNNGIVSELEARLVSVTTALDSIAKGTYGVCEVGGEPIEEKRLEANPSARTCIAHIDSL
jgi:DnaK suppressor protein